MPFPDFMIIGASRSGTSSLFLNLCQHPQILKPSYKEPHYFDNHIAKGDAWYFGMFPTTNRIQLTFEATPNYLYHANAPERISDFEKRHALELRFIVMLRNPINRTWSHFCHCKNRVNAHKLEVAISKSRRQPFVAKSVYIDQIERWQKHFDRSKFLFIRSEDFYRDSRGVCRAIFRWLGVDEIVLSKIKYYDPWKPNNFKKTKYKQCPPELRRRLADFFEPHNRRLYDFMGFDFNWE